MNRPHALEWALLVCGAALMLVIAGCGADRGARAGGGSEGTIRLGEPTGAEERLITALVRARLEDAGYPVAAPGAPLDPESRRKALLAGSIDASVGYTGAATGRAAADADGVVWLDPAPADAAPVIVTRNDVAERTGIVTMSDFARHVSSGGRVYLIGSEGFFADGGPMQAFERTYGFRLRSEQRLVSAIADEATCAKAVAEAAEGVDFGMGRGTDGHVSALGLTVLADDRRAQTSLHPALAVRRPFAEDHPALASLMRPVFESLDSETLRALNARVELNGEAVDAVALDFLRSRGLIKR